MKLRLVLILTLALACLAKTSALNADDGFSTTTKQTTYVLQSNSVEKLVAEMKQKGPTDDGKRFFAKTDWQIRWNYEYDRENGGFVITKLSVRADITYRMPQRVLPAGTSDALAEKWARFLAALTLHEEGHAQIATTNAKALHEKLRSHGPFPNAQELEKFVKTEGGKCLQKARTEEVEYDRRTGHGATQGALLR